MAKFTQGAWIIARTNASGSASASARSRPRGTRSLVVVPVHSVSTLTREPLSAAMALGDEVTALRVVYPNEPADMAAFGTEWEAWHPEVHLAVVDAPHRDLGRSIVDFQQTQTAGRGVFVLIAEIEPERYWQRLLRNHRGGVIDRAVRRNGDAIVCRLRFRRATSPSTGDHSSGIDPGRVPDSPARC